MAKPNGNNATKPATKAEAIRLAIRANGGLNRADTARVAAYVRDKWGMEVKNTEVSQMKSNLRARLRESGSSGMGGTPVVADQYTSRKAMLPGKKAVEAMMFDDIRTVSRLVRAYGLNNVLDVARACAHELEVEG